MDQHQKGCPTFARPPGRAKVGSQNPPTSAATANNPFIHTLPCMTSENSWSSTNMRAPGFASETWESTTPIQSQRTFAWPCLAPRLMQDCNCIFHGFGGTPSHSSAMKSLEPHQDGRT